MGNAMLKNVAKQVQSMAFHAYQEESGFFSKSRSNLTVVVHFQSLVIQLEGGVAEKIPKRQFPINEVYQICAYNTNCNNVAAKGQSMLSIVYCLTILLKDRNAPEISFLMDKSEYKRFQIAVQERVNTEDKRHLFIIKQHIVPKRKIVSFAGSGPTGLGGSAQPKKQVIQTSTKVVTSATTRDLTTVQHEASNDPDQRSTISYNVTVRKSTDKDTPLQGRILVSFNQRN